MSMKKDVILFSPPLFLNEQNKETHVSGGHICSNCHGKGFIHVEGKDKKKHGKETCTVCQGGGKLKGVATIEWLPDTKEEQSQI